MAGPEKGGSERTKITRIPEWNGRFRDLALELLRMKEIKYKNDGESDRDFNIRVAEMKLGLKGVASELEGILGMKFRGIEEIKEFKVELLRRLAGLANDHNVQAAEDLKKL